MNRYSPLAVLAVSALLLGAGCGEDEQKQRQEAAAQKKAAEQRKKEQEKQQAEQRQQAAEQKRKEKEAEARKTVNTFIKAANNGDGNKACKQIDAKLKRKFPGRCPQAVVSPEVVPKNARIQVLVAGGNSGFALVKGSGGKSTRVTLRYKGGRWRITE